ncbi:MAG TPA: ABC transporter substrate-binding protein [Aggregatilineaceae bacterium]|nr:ABC transporter substrate-binding protein [Aggregatilineaceae bacterium]
MLTRLVCLLLWLTPHFSTDAVRQTLVAQLGDVPVLALIVEAPLLLNPNTDPADADWSDIGLLVTSELTAAAYPAWIDAAEEAGVPVFLIPAIHSLEMWRTTALGLGQAAGQESHAQHLIQRLDRRISVVQIRAQRLDAPVRVLVITPEAYTFGRDTMITELIELAGGINVAAAAGFEDYRQINDETVRDLAPDVILLTPGWAVVGDFAAYDSARVFRLAFNPTLPHDPGAALLWLSLAFPTH